MTMKRRTLLAGGLAFVATPRIVRAQAVNKVWHIGILSLSISKEFVYYFLLPSLRGVGYEEGRNLEIDFRFAQGKVDLLPGLAAELVARKPDLLIGPLNQDVAALRKATSTVPIVMLYVSAPVETGLIASLARPGGNLTGATTVTPEVAGKSLQLICEMAPRISSVACLVDPDYPGMDLYWNSASQAATALGLRAVRVSIRTPSDLTAALARLEFDRADALTVSMTGTLAEDPGRVIEFAAQHKLPALYSISAPVYMGGLMSYGQDFTAVHSRVAWMIDKIFNGAKPSDMPVEQPTRFRLVINAKTAKTLGITIPQSLLLRADAVI